MLNQQMSEKIFTDFKDQKLVTLFDEVVRDTELKIGDFGLSKV